MSRSTIPQHVLVVGAGAVGLCTAWSLHRRGIGVTVLDRAAIGDSASCGNAGLISFGHPPLTRPGVSLRGLRWMFDQTSPLYVRPRLDGDLARWLWTFHRHCRTAHFERAMAVLCHMGRLAADTFDAILEDTTIDCDWRPNGYDDVCLTDAGMRAAVEEGRLVERFGLRTRRIDGAELRAERSCWREEVLGAVRFEESASLDPRSFVAGLADELARRGVAFRFDASVSDVVVEQSPPRRRVRGVVLESGEPITADGVVIAAGVWSDSLARAFDLSIPMQPARGYHVDHHAPDVVPHAGAVLHETFVAVTPMHDRLRLAGTLEIAGYHRPWMRTRLEALRAGAARYLHGIRDAAPIAEWAGYRPCTADGLPVIGAAPGLDGAWIGTGHAMMGMTLAPATGEMLARGMIGERSGFDGDAVDPARHHRPIRASSRPAS